MRKSSISQLHRCFCSVYGCTCNLQIWNELQVAQYVFAPSQKRTHFICKCCSCTLAFHSLLFREIFLKYPISCKALGTDVVFVCYCTLFSIPVRSTNICGLCTQLTLYTGLLDQEGDFGYLCIFQWWSSRVHLCLGNWNSILMWWEECLYKRRAGSWSKLMIYVFFSARDWTCPVDPGMQVWGT